MKNSSDTFFFFAFTVTTQSVNEFSEWIQGNTPASDAVDNILFNTIPAWLQGSVLDAALKEKGLSNSVLRGTVKTVLSNSYLAGADAIKDLWD